MDTNNLKKNFDKVIEHLKDDFWKLQIWRASTSLLETIDIFVQSYWSNQPLNQLANIVVLDSQTLKVEPWDKSIISSIEKWIFNSWLWLTPVNKWDHIILKIPPMSSERRKELTKVVSKTAEESKVSIRNIRHDFLKDLKKQFDDKLIWEDDKKNTEKKVEEIVKEYNKKIEDFEEYKSKEIMNV